MNTARFGGLFDLKDIHVILVGLGGIGSWTLLGLAKMGVRHLSAYDPDKVSPENVATQLYGQGMIGYPKAEAMNWLLNDLTQEGILEPYPYAILPGTEGLPPTRFLISAVDSIQARKDIWVIAKRSMWEWYIDARMSAMSLTIHCVNCKELDWYDRLLRGQDDSQVADEPCTSKATPFTGMLAGSIVTWAVAQLYRGEKVGKVICLDLTKSLNTQTI